MFTSLNQQNKILKLLKHKFYCAKTSSFFHFPRILNHCAKRRKFAKYEGLFFSKTLVVIGVLGQKSMSGKNVILEKMEPKTLLFLM